LYQKKMHFISRNIQIHDIDKMQSFMLNAVVPTLSLGCKWLSNKIEVTIFDIISLNALLPYLKFLPAFVKQKAFIRFLI